MTRQAQLIAVPYDSGHRGLRMGSGPLHLVAHGAAGASRLDGGEADVAVIDADAGFRTEVTTSFDLYRKLARTVAEVSSRGDLPIVLAGNCASAIGTISGLNAAAAMPASGTDDEVGIVWFDAHADFNTPETTTTGFLDGMALAMLTGRCWTTLTSSVPGFRPVLDKNVIITGARDIENAEHESLGESGVVVVPAEGGAVPSLIEALDALRNRVSRVYVHIDLDVHDAAEASANSYSLRGGLATSAVTSAVRDISDRFIVAAVALTAYDPEFDSNGRMLAAALDLIRTLAVSASKAE